MPHHPALVQLVFAVFCSSDIHSEAVLTQAYRTQASGLSVVIEAVLQPCVTNM